MNWFIQCPARLPATGFRVQLHCSNEEAAASGGGISYLHPCDVPAVHKIFNSFFPYLLDGRSLDCHDFP